MLELLSVLMCMGGKPPTPPAPPPPPEPPSPPAEIANITTKKAKTTGSKKTRVARRAVGKQRFTRPLTQQTGPTGLNIG